jgi:hypothetical protein
MPLLYLEKLSGECGGVLRVLDGNSMREQQVHRIEDLILAAFPAVLEAIGDDGITRSEILGTGSGKAAKRGSKFREMLSEITGQTLTRTILKPILDDLLQARKLLQTGKDGVRRTIIMGAMSKSFYPMQPYADPMHEGRLQTPHADPYRSKDLLGGSRIGCDSLTLGRGDAHRVGVGGVPEGGYSEQEWEDALADDGYNFIEPEDEVL